MSLSPLLVVHISSAIVGLFAGWAALVFRKGSGRHRAAGNVFVIAMLSMCASAVSMAVMKGQTPNIMAGFLTAYLVATAWLTTRRKPGEIGRFEFGAMLVGSLAGVIAFILGWQAVHSTADAKDQVPPAIYFVFGSVAFLSAAGDVRMLLRGGVSGAPRIVRHLWRMCLALFIAQASAFSGKRTQIFPEFIRKSHVLSLLIIAIPVLMIFWLIRVRFTNGRKKRVAAPLIGQKSASTLA